MYNTKNGDPGTTFTSWTQGGAELANQNLGVYSTLANNRTTLGTQTLAISPVSFAVGAGVADVLVPFDQRGETRFNPPTIGAFEYGHNETIYTNYSFGNDASGDGSSGSPYKTFHKAYTEAVPGDILDLSGTFDWSNADETGDAVIDGYIIDKDLTIRGQGADQTFIQAAGSLALSDRRVFWIEADSVSIKDVTLRYGKSRYGGGILNRGLVRTSFENVTITDNRAIDGGGGQALGGGIHNIGKLYILNSTLSNNVANGTLDGGGGLNTNNDAVIVNSTFYNNESADGAGIKGGHNKYLTLRFCTIASNIGQGLSVNWSYLTIQNTLLANNTVSDYHVKYGVHLTDDGYNLVETQTYEPPTPPTNWNLNQPTDILYSHDYLGNVEGGVGLGWNRNDASIGGSLNLSGTLAYNGTLNGTRTLALSSGSFAIGAGLSDSDYPTDQRGFSRFNPPCIGAYETGPTPGNALTLDGTNDYIKANTPFASLNNSSTYSFEAWIKPDYSTNPEFAYEIISITDNTADGSTDYLGFRIEKTTKKLQLGIDNATPWTSVEGNTALPENIWSHVAVTVNGTIVTFYINGVNDGGGAIVGKTLDGLDLLNMGAIDFVQGSDPSARTTDFFKGLMDEVRVWSDVRTATEISDNMDNVLSGAEPNLVDYYNFNHTSGTTLTDITGGNNGTLQNMTGEEWVESYAMVIPIADDITTFDENSFEISWERPETGEIENFFVEVDDNADFSSPLTGYNPKNAGADLSETITGLTDGTTYYARVWAYKTSASSGGARSQTKTVTTGSGFRLNINGDGMGNYIKINGIDVNNISKINGVDTK